MKDRKHVEMLKDFKQEIREENEQEQWEMSVCRGYICLYIFWVKILNRVMNKLYTKW